MEAASSVNDANAMVVAAPERQRLRRRLTKQDRRFKLKMGVAAQSMVILGMVGFSGQAVWKFGRPISSLPAPSSAAVQASLGGNTMFEEGLAAGESRRLKSTNATDDDHGHCESHKVPDGVGDFIIRVVGVLFIFVGIAIVCDEFFQPALEAISEALKLSPDVAGATFLAAGSSAPELFTSLSDAFSDCSASMGIGTIVGSAMFNILVIVALSCFVAGQSGASLLIDWRPVARDVCFYTLSIFMLAFYFDDGEVPVSESAVMVLAYFVYIIFMIFNEKIMAQCSPKVSPEDDKGTEDGEAAKALDKAAKAMEGGDEGKDGEMKPAGADEGKDGEDDDEGFWHRFEVPDGGPMDKILFAVSLPFIVAFTFTIPDCDQEFFQQKFKQVYWVSFVMSILWIGILCHFMVEWAHECAIILDVDPIVVALVILATGTSIPDAIGSMVAARSGEANMAIANAIGSNVFDILLGLGLPWMLSTLIKGDTIEVNAEGIQTYVGILLGTVILFVLILIGFNWKMNMYVGGAMFALYFVFFIYCLTNA